MTHSFSSHSRVTSSPTNTKGAKYFTILVWFSETFHGQVQGLACTSPFHKVIVEISHKLQRGLVNDRPEGDQNRTSASTHKGTCNTDHTFRLDLSLVTVTTTKHNQSCPHLNTQNAIVKMKFSLVGIRSARLGSGVKAVFHQFPCAPELSAKWTKATELSPFNTSLFVASLSVRGLTLRIFPIIFTSCLAHTDLLRVMHLFYCGIRLSSLWSLSYWSETESSRFETIRRGTWNSSQNAA